MAAELIPINPDEDGIRPDRWFSRLGLCAIFLAVFGNSAQATPLNPPVAGPKLLCFKYSTFSLGAAERVIDFTAGEEGVMILVDGPSGHYEIDESEIFAAPPIAKHLVYSTGEEKIYRIAVEQRYAIYGSHDFYKDRPLLWVSGAAVKGTRHDLPILKRFDVRDPREVKCEQKFTYGWL